MARDCELLRAAEDGIFCGRIYFWDVPTVSLGRFQVASEVVLGGLTFVSRPTGGAAVLHGHDLTFGLAAPLEFLQASPRQVRFIYRSLVGPIVAAFRELGIPAALGEDVEGSSAQTRSAYCFSLHSKNDVIHTETGAKLCGCALRVTDSAALLQASIPVSSPVRHPSECIVGGVDGAWVNVDPTKLSGALKRRASELCGSCSRRQGPEQTG